MARAAEIHEGPYVSANTRSSAWLEQIFGDLTRLAQQSYPASHCHIILHGNETPHAQDSPSQRSRPFSTRSGEEVGQVILCPGAEDHARRLFSIPLRAWLGLPMTTTSVTRRRPSEND